jgi:diguanylate cyclase (GGDEF)-like protein
VRTKRIDLSPQSWGRVIVWTAAGSAACVAVTLLVDAFNLVDLTDPQRFRGVLIDVLLPLALAVPLLLFFTSKLRELAIAHAQLASMARTDSLTNVLSRGAFTASVEDYLSGRSRRSGDGGGALLVFDADNFKAINDTFGHDVGDDALRLIALAMTRTLRNDDRIGRVGGEEFAVFLPGLTAAQAETVGERIRIAVSKTGFAPDGQHAELTISVGGIASDRPMPFRELFRLADKQLYLAKRSGRNCVRVADAQSRVAAAA